MGPGDGPIHGGRQNGFPPLLLHGLRNVAQETEWPDMEVVYDPSPHGGTGGGPEQAHESASVKTMPAKTGRLTPKAICMVNSRWRSLANIIIVPKSPKEMTP